MKFDLIRHRSVTDVIWEKKNSIHHVRVRGRIFNRREAQQSMEGTQRTVLFRRLNPVDPSILHFIESNTREDVSMTR